ncbi:hypothetical protein ST47_g9426 [Ascochyta rabiei]|uniref:Uncharacterized protein n=1 Tax=Didymella rabiei TaxID=5454 RepID=A0A162XEV2_DIDRA|nr:hypothetical protein ST47_g9426 [Ascochyta rabiei]
MSGICTANPPASLPPPVNEAGVLELVVTRDDGERDVDARVMEDSSADKLDSKAPSSDGVAELSEEVGTTTTASEALEFSVSSAVVGVAVALGTAPTRLANVVASAGVEKTSVLISWAKMLDAALSSVAVVL